MSFAFTENWLEKYGGAYLQDSCTVTELDSSVSCGEKGYTKWRSEELEDCGQDGAMAPRYPQGRCLKFYRGLGAGGPEGGVYTSNDLSVMKKAPEMSWWGALDEVFNEFNLLVSVLVFLALDLVALLSFCCFSR